MDASQLIDQTIALLQPVGHYGPEIATKVAASALWDWLKEKFSRRSAAAAEAVTEVEMSPGQEVNWQVLRAQLAKALAEDEALRRELTALVAQHAPATSQKASVTGDQNVVVQVHGSANATNVQR